MTLTQQAGKERLLAVLSDSMPKGTRWAIRGGKFAIDRWLTTESVKDLDLWLHEDDLAKCCTALSPHIRGVISLESDSRWLRHVVFVMSESCGNQLLDITYGDLGVGGTLTCPEAQVITEQGGHGPVLSGVSVVADLVLRKLLRGKLPRKDQLAEARDAWRSTPADEQARWQQALVNVLGTTVMDRVTQLLEGAPPRRWDRAVFVRAAIQTSWRQAGLGLMIRRRRRWVVGSRARTQYKRPMAPVLLIASNGDDARKLQSFLQELGARHFVDAAALQGPLRFLQAGVLGKAIIATQDELVKLPRLTQRLYGRPLSPDISDQRRAIAQYLTASHRWYIDCRDMAERLAVADKDNV